MHRPAGRRVGAALAAYFEASGTRAPRASTLACYDGRWCLQEIADGCARILFGASGPDGDAHAWTELAPHLPVPLEALAARREAVAALLRPAGAAAPASSLHLPRAPEGSACHGVELPSAKAAAGPVAHTKFVQAGGPPERCGEDGAAPMKCPRCGFAEEDTSLVCSRCGKVLRETADVLSEEREEQVKTERANTGRRNAIVAVVVVVVLALGGFGTYKLIVGPPAKVVGNWTNTGYGGLLALLSGGMKLQISTEQSGKLTGTFSDNNTTQVITKGTVNGKHISISTAAPSHTIYYTVVGSTDSNGDIDVVVTTYNTLETPPTKTSSSTTLTPATAGQ